MIRVSPILLCLCLCATVLATDRYVDGYIGSHSHTYDPATRTVGSGSSIVYPNAYSTGVGTLRTDIAPGDTVYFRGAYGAFDGVYRNTSDGTNDAPSLVVATSGTAGSVITYRNYPGETPVISGDYNGDITRNHYYAAKLGAMGPTAGPYPSGTAVAYITIDGLRFTAAHAAGLLICGLLNPNGVTSGYTHDIVVKNCLFYENIGRTLNDRHAGIGSGVKTWATCENITIQDCEGYTNTGAVIHFDYVSKDYDARLGDHWMNGTRNSTIQRCFIHDNYYNADGAGNTDGIVIADCYNILCQDNIVYKAEDDGIDCYYSYGCTLKNNVVFDCNIPTGNGSGMKISAGSGGNHVVLGNIIFRNGGAGLEACTPSNKLRPFRPSRVLSNTIYYNSYPEGSYAFAIGNDQSYDYDANCPKMLVYNNIIAYAGNAVQEYVCSTGGTISTTWLDSDYNRLHDSTCLTTVKAWGTDSHSTAGTIHLANPDGKISKVFQSGWTLAQKMTYIRNQVYANFAPAAVTPATLIDKGHLISGYYNPTAGAEGALRAWYGAASDLGASEVALPAITDLLVSGTAQNSVSFTWTAPGGSTYRQPTQYDVRYATSLLTEATWNAATPVPGVPVPDSPGTQQSFTLTGLDPGSPYYVAVKTRDPLGDISSLSNVVSGTTATTGNHAPVLSPMSDQSIRATQALTFAISATDVDPGDTLTYAAAGLPTGAAFVPSTRTFSWTPVTTQEGTYYVTFQVTDSQVTVSETIAITVLRDVNHPPVLDPTGNKSINENEALTFSIHATDADGDVLAYSATNLPNGATFVDRTFSWTPTYDQAGSCAVTFMASDGTAQDSETITISVINVNRPPALGAIGNQSVNENASLTFSVSATDPDGDSLTYSATGLPSGAHFANRAFSWTPSYDQAGSYPVVFTVSDGTLTDSEQITITAANISDQTPPSAEGIYPAANAIQVPVNSVIALTISDAGSGLDASTVAIRVNNQLVYSGDSSLYESAYGTCRRTGTRASYHYYYHSAKPFDFDQQVTVQVNASDAANNAMTPLSYQFTIQARSFGRNQAVSASGESSGHPVVATDSQGNLWAAWHAGPADARDIYVAKRGHLLRLWDAPVRLTTLASDHCNPVIAVGPGDVLYVAWQDNRRGNWDIFASVSADGAIWSEAIGITDAQDDRANQANPAIVATAAGVYVAWEDDGAGNQDICLASSSTSFASKTVTRITTNTAGQTEPALAVGSGDVVYLVWTDQRNGLMDIYGSSSSASSWANVQIVTDQDNQSNQSNPAIAVEPGTSMLHLLWVDDAAGNLDVVHGVSNGLPLPGNPISGTIIVDDDTDREADQSAPRIAATQDYWDTTHVYACWQDDRSTGSPQDSDLYFGEIRSGAGGANILVGDDGTNSNQSEPVLGCDEYGHPVVLWTDSRGSPPRIYSASSVYMKPGIPLASALITRATGGRVGTDPASIDDAGDVSIQIPPSAYDCDVAISIAEILNIPRFTSLGVVGYEIGPSGIQFAFPVTVTIPYTASGSGRVTPYWYDPSLSAVLQPLSQSGMTEITNTTLANGVPVVSFKTNHLTAFFLLETPLPNGGHDGGGCAMSGPPGGNIFEFMLPFLVLVPFMYVWKRRDQKGERAFKGAPYS